MLVEIKGVQFVNKGAELMLLAVIEQLRQWCPQAELALLPGPNSPYEKRARLGALQIVPLQFYRLDLTALARLLPRFFKKRLRDWFGIVFQSDIDLVLDASGFAYGDRWGRFGVKFLAANTRLVQQQGGQYVLLPQAFGPFHHDIDQRRMAQAVKHSVLVYARDADSLQHLQASGCEMQRVRLCPDFTNLVKPLPFVHPLATQPYAVVIPNYQMVFGKPAEQATQYRRLMIEYIKICRDAGLAVVVLNHEGVIDADICSQLKQAYAEDSQVGLVQPDNALEVKGCIGQAAIVFSSRFHGCVSALSQGVPCIGTGWSHKYEHLFADYDCLDCLVSLDTDPVHLSALVTQGLTQAARPALLARSAELQQRVSTMWQEIADKCARGA